ncbi:MAG: hypothetical protein H6709_19510 [Kofleriaceae bacterium]|nr:hypothetical protein [Myxococcales bacterium]MCB9562072.1 hypothetical protein [Kofleriaceae bacterium]MCB9574274.1 hypothetical protein [Kofleriaceae bacterium]
MSYRSTLHDRPWWYGRNTMPATLDTVVDEIDADVNAVAKANRMLRDQVRQLSTVVVVLLEQLEARGVVDLGELQAAVEDALRPPAAAADGSVPARMVTCAKCGAEVPSNQTTITDKLGEVCDACFDATA